MSKMLPAPAEVFIPATAWSIQVPLAAVHVLLPLESILQLIWHCSPPEILPLLSKTHPVLETRLQQYTTSFVWTYCCCLPLCKPLDTPGGLVCWGRTRGSLQTTMSHYFGGTKHPRPTWWSQA